MNGFSVEENAPGAGEHRAARPGAASPRCAATSPAPAAPDASPALTAPSRETRLGREAWIITPTPSPRSNRTPTGLQPRSPRQQQGERDPAGTEPRAVPHTPRGERRGTPAGADCRQGEAVQPFCVCLLHTSRGTSAENSPGLIPTAIHKGYNKETVAEKPPSP